MSLESTMIVYKDGVFIDQINNPPVIPNTGSKYVPRNSSEELYVIDVKHKPSGSVEAGPYTIECHVTH